MIPTTLAKAQLARLGSIPFMPADGLEEIEKAIASADSEGMAEAVISDWIHTRSSWPAPADLYAALEVIRERRRADSDAKLPAWKREPKCKECGDTGWKPFINRRTMNGATYSGVEICLCRRDQVA